MTAGLGLLLGAGLASWYAAGRTEVGFRAVFVGAAQLTIAGVLGARITWAATYPERLQTWRDVVDFGSGGLQFSGGFLVAAASGVFLLRDLPRRTKWVVTDGLAMGLCLGLLMGRLGCYLVGEHLGRSSSSWFAVRYEGGATRESTLGDQALHVGASFHHTALYEIALLAVLLTVLWAFAGAARPGMHIAAFCVVYGTGRFLIDLLRVNDQRLLGLTGAQYIMVVIIGSGTWIWRSVVPAIEGGPEEDAGVRVG